MRVSRSPRAWVLALVFAVTSALAFLSPATALTFPSETRKLLALRDELSNRGLEYLLDTWVCDDQECDPCGPTAGESDSWGAWHYVACRVLPENERAAEAKRPENSVVEAFDSSSRNISPDKREGKLNSDDTYYAVTNIHLSDLNIEGSFETLLRVLCPFSHLRELDLDGGRLVGPIPEYLGTCFPKLTELDLSHNNLNGALPTGPWKLMPDLLQVKLEDNRLSGSIPIELSYLTDLRVLWLDDNELAGSIPRKLFTRLNRLISFNVEDNPKLCGPAPSADINWRWHLDNQRGQVRDWFAFCEKDPCGVFFKGGTDVGTMCSAGSETSSSSSIYASPDYGCGKAFDQCGGTVAARLATKAEWNGGVSYDAVDDVLDDSNSIVVDVPFNGQACCRRGNECVDVPITTPCKSGSDTCAFRQCTPIDGFTRAPQTNVPPEVIEEWRNDIRSGGVDGILPQKECAPPFGQCGGTAAYLGPTCCEGNAPCFRVNEYFSSCDPTKCVEWGGQCGGEMDMDNTFSTPNPECCRAGSECVILNAGYHECVPGAKLQKEGLDSFTRASKSGKLTPIDAKGANDYFWTPERRGRCVAVNDQCGGFVGDDPENAYEEAQCCGLKTVCVRKNKWYAACERCAPSYGQCGGAEFIGGTCCADANDTCVKVDEYYSQCRTTL